MADKEIDLLALYRRGQKDAWEAAEPDWVFLGELGGGDPEIHYFRGYESIASDSVLQGDRPIEVPAALSGMVSEDLTLAVQKVLANSTDLIDPPKPGDVTSDDVEAALKAVIRESTSGEFRLYRTMDVSEEWFEEVGPDTDFGKHWSVVENHTIGHHGFNTHQALICADAPYSAVDWPETVACWLNNVENEIRLLEGARAEMKWVMRSEAGEEWKEVDVKAPPRPA